MFKIFSFGEKKNAATATDPKKSVYVRRGAWMVFFVLLVSVVAFWGRPPHSPIVFKGMKVDSLLSSQIEEFSYESAVLKRAQDELAGQKVFPVYKVKSNAMDDSLLRYEFVAKRIGDEFDELFSASEEERVAELEKIFSDEKIKDDAIDLARARKEISLLISLCGTRERFSAVYEQSALLFKTMAENGIRDQDDNDMLRYGVSPREFRRNFFSRLSFEGFSAEDFAKVRSTVLSLFAPLIKPNLVYDAEKTQEARDQAAAKVPPVVVKVREGDPILVPGKIIDDETWEKWSAYRLAQRDHEDRFLGLRFSFLKNLLYTTCVVVIAAFYCFLMVPMGKRVVRRRLVFAGVVSTLNILLVRGVLELSETESIVQLLVASGNTESSGGAILVWLSSPTVVAIAVSAIAGAPLGVLSSLFVGAIASLMLGGNIQILMMISVAALVAVWISRDAMRRATLVRAGFYSGLVTAAAAVFIGWFTEMPWDKMLTNIVASLFIGLFYGILSAGVLGILENIFRACTNISFIELADYNHPLLRKLQLVAPGTFHHCVMVANYAEAAAHEVGANTALCRCASLFHDIGKTQKPEYFTENQSNIANPHDGITPQMSALIIKSHVRDGLELAAEYHLPERIRAIIEQHHGTGLISYFIKKARDLATSNDVPGGAETVDESQFRYDGPKPQTLEAAIIMMCDVVEAASRSMKKFTQQSVDELVSGLIEARVRDGEFDECPITMAQIYAVRRSLVRSVLSTYHSRVEYPKEALAPAQAVPAESRARVRVIRKPAEN